MLCEYGGHSPKVAILERPTASGFSMTLVKVLGKMRQRLPYRLRQLFGPFGDTRTAATGSGPLCLARLSVPDYMPSAWRYSSVRPAADYRSFAPSCRSAVLWQRSPSITAAAPAVLDKERLFCYWRSLRSGASQRRVLFVFRSSASSYRAVGGVI